MGGRGSAGSVSNSMSKATSDQKTKMNRMQKRNKKYNIPDKYEYSKPTFHMNKDGSVSYDYTIKRIVFEVHNSKMQSEDKNDVYERTEYYSGKIMKDGLIKKDKKKYKDVLIRKGKRR